MGNDVVQNLINALDTWFQSSFPQGERRRRCWNENGCRNISILVPNAGNDDPALVPMPRPVNFNPRSQCRERRILLWCYGRERHFNPRSLYRERQQTYPNINIKQHYFRNILRFSFNIFSSLIYIVIQYSIFVQLFWCESPGIFMYTSYSHYQIAI